MAILLAFLGHFLVGQVVLGQESPQRIQIAPIDSVSITVNRSVAATSVSLQTAVIASQLSAEVVKMSLVPGDIVKQGQTIAKLDCRDHTLALNSARSQIATLRARQKLARQQLERLNKLRQNRNASEEQINQRQAELDIITAEIATQSIHIQIAERQVERCHIIAPFAGLITETPGGVGNFLSVGSPIATLVDIDQVELKALLLESQVSETESNPPFFEFAGRRWDLSLRTVFAIVDEVSQTREVRFHFQGQVPAPGTTGRLKWTLSGITVPATYVMHRQSASGQSENGIFIVRSEADTTVTFLPLPEATVGQPITIDIDPNLLIVTDGRFGLEDGQTVEIE